MAQAFKRKYIDIPVELGVRLKTAAAELLQSERAIIANAITAYLDKRDAEKAKAKKKPAKSGPTIQNRKR